MKSPSYNTGACCGDDCFALDARPDEPCWGDVGVAEEVEIDDGEFTWIHECKGHEDCYNAGGKYKPEPIQTK